MQEAVYELIEHGLPYFLELNAVKVRWFLKKYGIPLKNSSLLGWNSCDIPQFGSTCPKPVKWLIVDVVTEYCYPLLFFFPRDLTPFQDVRKPEEDLPRDLAPSFRTLVSNISVNGAYYLYGERHYGPRQSISWLSPQDELALYATLYKPKKFMI